MQEGPSFRPIYLCSAGAMLLSVAFGAAISSGLNLAKVIFMTLGVICFGCGVVGAFRIRRSRKP